MRLLLGFLASLLSAAQTVELPPSIVLQDVRLIDGTGAPARDHVQITITEGRISQIRSVLLRIAFPPNATVLNLSGKTVMPGLINGHGHLGLVGGTTVGPQNYTRENIERQLMQYERYGVTTVLSLGMNQDSLYALRDAQRKGDLAGATILTADRGIGVPEGMPPVKVSADQLYRPNSPEEARADVREMAARRPNVIKLWVDDNLGKLPKMKSDIYAAAIEESHAAHIPVACHLFYEDDARHLVNDGIDIIAHSIRDTGVSPETVALIKNKGVYYIPTLQLEESFFVYADRPDWMTTDFFRQGESRELAADVDSEAYRSKIENDKTTPVHRQAFKTAQLNLKRLSDVGAAIAFGTDSGANPYRIWGWAEHRELQLMVEAGLTPLQAIHCATATNAKMLHIADDTGTVERGKLADLLVLNSDPSQKISNTQDIVMVFHRGKQVPAKR